MLNITEEQIKVAIDWWGEALKDPKFDNGDRSETGLMCQMLATLSASKNDVSETSVENFKKCLAKRIKSNSFYGTLSVDYGPDGNLSDSLIEAGLESLASSLPWKTTMWINEEGVFVSCGYGAEREKLL